MIADPFRLVRRLALVTALVVLIGGTVFLVRRSVVPGVLYYLAGLLLAVAVARPSLVEAIWPGAVWHRAAIVRVMLVLAFFAFLGGTLALPRPSSQAAQSAATTAPTERDSAAALATATSTDPLRPTPVRTETPIAPPTVRPAATVVIVGEGAGRLANTPVPPPTSTLLPMPATLAPSPPLPDWDTLVVTIEEAWARADWPAAEAAVLRALDAYPQDPALLDKLFAARINRGDQLAEAGQRGEAARVYASAREVRRDPLVEERLARLTPTAVSRQSVVISGACQPVVIFLGDWFVVQLGLLNTGDAPLNGVRIKATGPWERFSMSRVEPVGAFQLEGSIVEPEFVTRQPIQPGQTVYMQAVAYADQSGQYLFSFRPARLDNAWLLDREGRVPLVGCGLAVYP